MQGAIGVLNELERDGVLGRYAIGGAMAAMFYVEPVSTYDLDVFVILPQQGLLLSLTPLYEALRQRGYVEESECVIIEGIAVQFLPAYNKLLEEALADAIEKEYQGMRTRVLSIEHLLAICLQTGRAKDRDRVRLFREEAPMDEHKINDILERHGLMKRWREWTNR